MFDSFVLNGRGQYSCIVIMEICIRCHCFN